MNELSSPVHSALLSTLLKWRVAGLTICGQPRPKPIQTCRKRSDCPASHSRIISSRRTPYGGALCDSLRFRFCFAFCSIPAWAQDSDDTGTAQSVQVDPDPSGAPAQNSPGPQSQPAQHPTATTYSNGYEVRLKIHRYASYATLPLFATEFALGQSLYDNPERGSKRTAHGIIGAGIVGLFAANTVTGVWNLWESPARLKWTQTSHPSHRVDARGRWRLR